MLLKAPGMDRCQYVNDLIEAWKFRLITRNKTKQNKIDGQQPNMLYLF